VDLDGQRLALLGYGVENQALGAWLTQHGFTFAVCDTDPDGARPATHGGESCHDAVVEWRLGDTALSRLEDFDILFRSPGIRLRRSELVAAERAGICLSSGIDLFLERCQAPVIGVTGTKGKGTTASMLFAILHAVGMPARLGGNIGIPPLTFLDELGADEQVILELSSFQLQDLGRSPAGAVLLPIATDHLDYHETHAEYVGAKGEICRQQSSGDWVLAAAGCATARELACQSAGGQLRFSGTSAVHGDGCWVEEERIRWRSGGSETVVGSIDDVRIPGVHNLHNACAAVGAAILAGVTPEETVAGLRAFVGLPHRLETVAEHAGVTFVNDSLATTPEAATAGLRAWVPRAVVLIAGGSGKGADFALLGEAIAQDAAALVTMGHEGGRIVGAARQAGFAGVVRQDCQSMEAAVTAAIALAKPGGVVLLSPACASFGMFASYAERGEAFRRAVTDL
jgi:UDP-N-acetylmuramoylalanine--D-glutamate ligase